MTNWYPKAIEALSKNRDVDELVELVYKIAQKRPKAIVDACASAPDKESEWIEECKQLVRSGKKIDAIKLWRNQADIGLKEAKDAVEALVL